MPLGGGGLGVQGRGGHMAAVARAGATVTGAREGPLSGTTPPHADPPPPSLPQDEERPRPWRDMRPPVLAPGGALGRHSSPVPYSDTPPSLI